MLTEWSVFGKTMTEVEALPVRPQPGHLALDAPNLIGGGPIAQFGSGEPEADLELGGFRGIGAVDHIAADVHGQVAADRAGLCLEGLGREAAKPLPHQRPRSCIFCI